MKNNIAVVLILVTLTLATSNTVMVLAQNKAGKTASTQGRNASTIGQCIKDELARAGKPVQSINVTSSFIAEMKVLGILDAENAKTYAKIACQCGAGSTKTEGVTEPDGGSKITLYVATCDDLPLGIAVLENARRVELSKNDMIAIHVDRGVVTLTGKVRSQKTKVALGKAAYQAGAKKVINKLRVAQ